MFSQFNPSPLKWASIYSCQYILSHDYSEDINIYVIDDSLSQQLINTIGMKTLLEHIPRNNLHRQSIMLDLKKIGNNKCLEESKSTVIRWVPGVE